MKKLSSRGFTLVELMIAVTIMATMAAGVMQARYFMAQQTQKNSDKAFATEKAIQMMEELRTLVNSTNQVNVLDSYGDTVTISGGNSVTVFNPVLTTDQSVSVATNVLSGNMALGTGYKFYRFIQIVPSANDPTVRTVSVQVFASNPNNQAQAGQELAQVTSVLRTNSTVFQPSQTLDVYVLALNNVLGWFTTVPEMADTFGQAVTDLHTRNPALNFRMHVIDQTGFGRDPYYKPFINDTNFADTTAMPFAYFYPGWDHETSGTNIGGNEQFFADTGSSGLQSVGNVLDDDAGGATEAVTTTGFSISDTFNNDVRWPDEQLDYAVLTTNAVASGQAAPQITLRMLLEEMNSEPQSFTNAIIVSMHGEVLPLPPIRNYSDPAKDPYNNPNVRVVTHPERIYYPNTTPAGVNLRVYAYIDGLEKSQSLSNFTTQGAATISIVIPGVNLTTSEMSVTAIDGGITAAGATVGYNYYEPAAGIGNALPAADGASMWWNESGGSSGTTITLGNTPLRCPQYTGTSGLKYSGLPPGELLYGTEYISCPTTASATLTTTSQATNFTPDLTDTTNSTTKAVNTARWIIHIDSGDLPNGQAVTFVTSLGPPSYASTVLGSFAMPVSGTGTTITYSEDLSKTYTWIGNGTKLAAPPFTEQFQFNGDPRDCPYYDVKCGYYPSAGDVVTIAAGGYNWYFKNLSGNPDGFSGFSMTQNTYQGGSIGGDGDIRDMPRYYYLYRNALLSTESIFTNLNGYTCWHAGEGGEFGDTYDNWSGSLPFIDTPWNPEEAVTAKVTVSEVQKQGGCFSYKIGATTYNGPGLCTVAKDDGAGPNNPYTGGNWWAESWRGELFPDDQFSSAATVGWISYGNLISGKNKFYRLPIAEIQNTTTSLDGFPNPWYGHDVGSIGPADFLGGVSSGSVTSTPMGFMHTDAGGNEGNSVLTNMGFNLYSLANFPLASPVSCTRAWGDNVNLTTNGTVPTEWTSPFYQKLATSLSYPQYGSPTTLQQFYDASSFSASPFNNAVAGMQMNYPITSPTQSAFYIFSGLAPQANFPQLDLAETGLICSLRSYLDAGLYTGINHITQLPLIQIYTPLPAQEVQGSINVTWGQVLNSPSLWERWGDASYTEQYPVTWTEPSDPTVVYNVKFNVGCTGNSIANCPCSFVNDFSAAQLGVFKSSEAVTATSMTFNLATLPRGFVDVIVEAYRQSADTEGSGSVTVGNYYPLHYSWHAIQFYNF